MLFIPCSLRLKRLLCLWVKRDNGQNTQKKGNFCMQIPHDKWFQAIKTRKSRRAFDGRRPAAGTLERIEDACTNFRPFDGARAVLVHSVPDDLFSGAVGPYGKIKGAQAFVAFIGNIKNQYYQEQTGYTGQGIILEAEASGLATCWVAGFFRRQVVKSQIPILENEEVLAITPIGHAPKESTFMEKSMTGFGLTHRRKPLSELVAGLNKQALPDWITAALGAARLAPSAVNWQPWRFEVEDQSITVSVNSADRFSNVSKRLDCGIAMLHIETAALYYGIKGKWQFLQPPAVARFRSA